METESWSMSRRRTIRWGEEGGERWAEQKKNHKREGEDFRRRLIIT